MKTQELEQLKQEIRRCTLCEPGLPLGANPVLRGNKSAKILVAGQAPGIRVHNTSVPFNDPSGVRLRQWLGIDEAVFYDEDRVAIVPMGFCYPGTGKSGDLPPRPECAKTWHRQLLALLPNVELVLAIGQYAQKYHLKDRQKKNLTETVRAWQEYAPAILPLPHPSPRNNIWLRRNPWFEQQVLPYLKSRVGELILPP
ncbi:uracil-DNA glycosylase family protein [Thalassomonas viridans]|uniref:Uracil-DNA glycosylase family protein n=1 Tax=Thalassomonas viridans TaxID=137584 RepID=A0AAF0C9S9_9GAMM|nr:uracil-DNA glycosylase family protein [Thalassomonas viridans]WDE06118.1 uracil-DNA glycosylase family protein [Thalassomonas viridans]